MGKIFNLSGILIISGNFDKKNGHPVEEFTNNGCIRTFVNISFFFHNTGWTFPTKITYISIQY